MFVRTLYLQAPVEVPTRYLRFVETMREDLHLYIMGVQLKWQLSISQLRHPGLCQATVIAMHPYTNVFSAMMHTTLYGKVSTI